QFSVIQQVLPWVDDAGVLVWWIYEPGGPPAILAGVVAGVVDLPVPDLVQGVQDVSLPRAPAAELADDAPGRRLADGDVHGDGVPLGLAQGAVDVQVGPWLRLRQGPDVSGVGLQQVLPDAADPLGGVVEDDPPFPVVAVQAVGRRAGERLDDDVV